MKQAPILYLCSKLSQISLIGARMQLNCSLLKRQIQIIDSVADFYQISRSESIGLLLGYAIGQIQKDFLKDSEKLSSVFLYANEDEIINIINSNVDIHLHRSFHVDSQSFPDKNQSFSALHYLAWKNHAKNSDYLGCEIYSIFNQVFCECNFKDADTIYYKWDADSMYLQMVSAKYVEDLKDKEAQLIDYKEVIDNE